MDKKDNTLYIRVTKAQKEKLLNEANKLEITLSNYVSLLINGVIVRQTKD